LSRTIIYGKHEELNDVIIEKTLYGDQMMNFLQGDKMSGSIPKIFENKINVFVIISFWI